VPRRDYRRTVPPLAAEERHLRTAAPAKASRVI
jgi:hypothetical protein